MVNKNGKRRLPLDYDALANMIDGPGWEDAFLTILELEERGVFRPSFFKGDLVPSPWCFKCLNGDPVLSRQRPFADTPEVSCNGCLLSFFGEVNG